ncbi:MAG: hypothetical protein ACJ8B6_10000, partial [Gemmatimonadales bacterium]
VLNFVASPDGAQVAFAALAKSAIASGQRRLMFGFMPIAGGIARTAHMLEPREPPPSMSWNRDGTMYLARALPKDTTPSLWQMSPESGTLARIGDLPDRCSQVSIMVGDLGHSAVCLTEDMRSDIWLVETERENE